MMLETRKDSQQINSVSPLSLDVETATECSMGSPLNGLWTTSDLEM